MICRSVARDALQIDSISFKAHDFAVSISILRPFMTLAATSPSHVMLSANGQQSGRMSAAQTRMSGTPINLKAKKQFRR
jgi:hypothetical protein